MSTEYADSAADASYDTPDSRGHEGLSLKVKGVLAFIVFVLYALLVGIFTDAERQKLLLMVEDLERVHRSEELVVQFNMSMARTLLSVNVAFSATDPLAAAPGAVIEIEATRSLLRTLEDKHPRILILSHELQALTNDMVQLPGRGVLAITRTTLHELITELDQITQATRDRKSRLLAEYRVTYDRVTLQGLAFAVLGIIVLGAATAIFFSRLTWDIRKLESRALDIVNGYRGEPLDVTRRDEVGSLMQAVNLMQQDLRETRYGCLRYFIGDVRDRQRLEMAMRDVDCVVHAAARYGLGRHCPTSPRLWQYLRFFPRPVPAMGQGARRVTLLSPR